MADHNTLASDFQYFRILGFLFRHSWKFLSLKTVERRNDCLARDPRPGSALGLQRPPSLFRHPQAAGVVLLSLLKQRCRVLVAARAHDKLAPLDVDSSQPSLRDQSSHCAFAAKKASSDNNTNADQRRWSLLEMPAMGERHCVFVPSPHTGSRLADPTQSKYCRFNTASMTSSKPIARVFGRVPGKVAR